MNPSPLSPPVQAYLPDFTWKFAFILTSLAKLIAHRFLHDPRFASLIVPLCNRLTRIRLRFERLMARLAAGLPARPSRPRPARPHGKSPALALPTTRGWLVVALGYQAANYASQLEALLAEAEAKELLSVAPSLGRILRPIQHILSRNPATPRQKRAPPKPRQPRPPRLLERVPRNWRKTWEWLRTPLPPEPA